MSVQFGQCNFDGNPVDPVDLDQVRPMLAPYGPDIEGYFCKENLGILFRAFGTTRESRAEVQPHISLSGSVLTWDGRLDNRQQLIGQMESGLSSASTDLSIVVSAYERWGTDSFAKLVGDWALSIWDPRSQSLVLARDFVGTRHLHYSVENNRAMWCTILDPLIRFAVGSIALKEEYIAGWLSFYPAPHLTPYAGIQSVPPSSFVCIEIGKQTTCKFWDFDPAKNIRYRSDTEYEEHFRAVFGESVRRRLRSDTAILAELSGGMDSSSIVCMADTLIERGVAETPRLDTLSYYNDSEPNWNERPYFTRVEEQRGQAGRHIDVSSEEPFSFDLGNGQFMTTPSSRERPNESARQFSACLVSNGNRVVLSGIGGDEVMGGVPSPIPALADLMARARLRALAQQLKVWALNKRKPWFHLFLETVRGFLPPPLAGVPKNMQPAPWLHPNFVERNRTALLGYPSRIELFGSLPSFQDNVATLHALRRQMGCFAVPPEPTYEKRYPYLDRDLLEFIYAIGHEQLVRPGQRRSLMRRALVGIVPNEILDRKRKAFVARAPMTVISTRWATLIDEIQNMVCTSLGIVDQEAFYETLKKARNGHEIPTVTLMRTLHLELWLRSLTNHGILNTSEQSDGEPQVDFGLMKSSARLVG